MPDEETHELLEIGKIPIAGENVVGVAVKYEPVFEGLEAELAKLESLTAETVDWSAVKNISADILQNHSKDFLVACYLLYSLALLEGYAGVHAGVRVLKDLIDTYWEDMFPPVKRLRARQTAIVWLVEKLGPWLSENQPSPADAKLVLETADVLKEIDIALGDKMADKAPLMRDITRPFKDLKKSMEVELKKVDEVVAPQPGADQGAPIAASVDGGTSNDVPVSAPAAPAPVAQSAPAPVAASSAAAPIGDIASDKDAKKAIKQLQDGLKKMGAYHVEAKISEPKGYRLTRIALWMNLDAVPPNEGGKTQVPPPSADRVKKLQGLLEAGESAEFLKETEKTLSKAPYWFDGQRMLVNGMDAVGMELNKAREVVIAELRQFITRLPQIKDFKYSDDTPFADEQTQMWLKTEVLVAGTADADSGSQGAGDAITAVKADAQKLAVGGKAGDAISLLNEGLNTASTMREQYQWRLAMAELMLSTGNASVAVNLLERMTRELDALSLEKWEPGVPAEAYRLLLSAYDSVKDKKDKNDEAYKVKIDNAFEQLCWYDPASAVK